MDEIVPESDPSDDDTEVPKRSRSIAAAIPRKRHSADLVHSSVWFRQRVTDALWLPAATAVVQKPQRPRQRGLRSVRSKKPKKRKRKKRGVYPKRAPRFVRDRLPTHVRVVEPLLTSWFDVSNFTDEIQASRWSSLAIATPSNASDPDNTEQEDSDSDEDPVNSVIKLRLFPTSDQKVKLDLMFSTNRAIYN
ncbi:hypothetical protein V7S43_013977 [Phytophthora oleae]|uniref:Transposase putative helix-turn-helix domain-containing protein n=1 Tax=Phytophthora oleae TaxID=2107226 RepID=A0ABD3F2C2_9STRA